MKKDFAMVNLIQERENLCSSTHTHTHTDVLKD